MSDPLPESRPTLRCFEGREAPPGIADDLRALLEFPPRAKERFWGVLGPCLAEPLPRHATRMLDQFAHTFVVDPKSLGRAIRACRVLVRQAALLDMDAAALAADVRALGADTADVAEMLQPGFDAAKAQVRDEVVRGALTDHGALLEAVDWRVDHVAGSSRSERVRVPVALLTFRYRDGAKQERLTLHVTVAKLRELKAVVDKLLG